MAGATRSVLEMRVQLGAEELRLAASGLERILPAAWPDPPAPGDPPAVVGRLDVEGASLPLLDLADFVGLPSPPLAADERFALVSAEGGCALVRVGRIRDLKAACGTSAPLHDLRAFVDAAFGLQREGT